MNIGEYVQVLQFTKENMITAWRGWNVYVTKPYNLYSVSQGERRGCWSRIKHAHETPAQGNNSGLWSLKEYWNPNPSKGCLLRNPYRGKIQGRVQLWGTIVEHEYGYRAQHAEITGIIVREAGDIADWYAHILGVERLKMKPVTEVVTYNVDTWPSLKPK